MNRLEFLTSLRYCLENKGLAQSEINDALSYYEEIFLDAGRDREQEVSQNLGSPEEVARQILIDNGIHVDGEPEYKMDDVIKNDGFKNRQNAQNGNPSFNGSQGFENAEDFTPAGDGYRYNSNQYNDDQAKRNGNLTKFVLILVTFPIWVPVAAVAFSLTVALFAVAFSLVVALGAAGLGCTVGGLAALFTVPPVGICVLGVGLIALGLFGLIVIPVVKMIFRAGVSVVNGCISLIRRVFGIGGARDNG
ncbi:MAG: hypothetical protein Q4E74_02260 [Ruminococcus sp.]|nr:hypothetical protein [Ruminococcus sp.]